MRLFDVAVVPELLVPELLVPVSPTATQKLMAKHETRSTIMVMPVLEAIGMTDHFVPRHASATMCSPVVEPPDNGTARPTATQNFTDTHETPVSSVSLVADDVFGIRDQLVPSHDSVRALTLFPPEEAREPTATQNLADKHDTSKRSDAPTLRRHGRSTTAWKSWEEWRQRRRPPTSAPQRRSRWPHRW